MTDTFSSHEATSQTSQRTTPSKPRPCAARGRSACPRASHCPQRDTARSLGRGEDEGGFPGLDEYYFPSLHPVRVGDCVLTRAPPSPRPCRRAVSTAVPIPTDPAPLPERLDAAIRLLVKCTSRVPAFREPGARDSASSGDGAKTGSWRDQLRTLTSTAAAVRSGRCTSTRSRQNPPHPPAPTSGRQPRRWPGPDGRERAAAATACHQRARETL